eukprot:3171949-Rhodomonas_salina.2
MARKFVLTSLIIFLWPGSPEQLAVCLIITFVAFTYVIVAAPFAEPKLGGLQAACLAVQAAAMLFGMMLAWDEVRVDSDRYHEVASAVTLIFLSTSIFLLLPVTIAYQNRREIGFGCRQMACCADLEDNFDPAGQRQSDNGNLNSDTALDFSVSRSASRSVRRVPNNVHPKMQGPAVTAQAEVVSVELGSASESQAQAHSRTLAPAIPVPARAHRDSDTGAGTGLSSEEVDVAHVTVEEQRGLDVAWRATQELRNQAKQVLLAPAIRRDTPDLQPDAGQGDERHCPNGRHVS